jgi:hypothetical protein
MMITLILATCAGLAGVGFALSFDPINEKESESK